MKIRNKATLCFFLLMFITLISCCIAAASDDVADNTTTTQNTVITEKDNYEVNNIQTAKTLAQSDDNTIGETDDQNDVKQENSINAKAKINKVSNITQRAVKGTQVSSWAAIGTSSGEYVLTADVNATSSKTIRSANTNTPMNYVLDGRGHVIDGSQCSDKYMFNFTVAPGSNVTIKNVIFNNYNGQIVAFKNLDDEVSHSSDVYFYVQNCTFNNIQPNLYGVINILSGISGNPSYLRNFYHGSIQDCEFNNCSNRYENKSYIYITGGTTYLTTTNLVADGKDLGKWDMGNQFVYKLYTSSGAKIRTCLVNVEDGFVNTVTTLNFSLYNVTYYYQNHQYGNNLSASVNARITYSLQDTEGNYLYDIDGNEIHDLVGYTDSQGNFYIRASFAQRGVYLVNYTFPQDGRYLPVDGYKKIVIQDALRYEVPENITKYVGQPLELSVNIRDPDDGRYTSEDWLQGIGYDANPSSNASHYRYYLDTGEEDENYFTRYVINGITMLNYQDTLISDNPSIKTYPEGYYYAFDIKSQYLGSLIYVPSTNFTTNVKIMREPTSTSIQNLSGSVNGIVGENVTLTANVINTRSNTPLNQGNITFKLENTVLGVVRINDGVATLNVTFNESVINGNLYAIFNDDYANEYTWLYNNSSAVVTLNIEREETVVESTESLIGNYHDNVTVIATVKDHLGNIVKSGVVTFKNGDVELANVTVDSNGQAKYVHNITDSVVITSFYNGTVKYKNSSNTTAITMFTIPTILSIEDLPTNVAVAEEFNFKVKLTDIDNNPLANQIISVSVNGNDIRVSGNTDANGYITAYYIPPNNANIAILASYTTDHKYRSNTTSASISSNNIRLIDTVMGIIVPDSVDVAVPFTFKVNLTNSSGEAIANRDVYVSILGESVSVSYDSNQKLYVGTYTPKDNSNIIITANTPADHVYNSSSAINDTLTTGNIGLIKTNLTLTISQNNKVANPVTITASLTNRSGDNVQGSVRVFINDEPVRIIDTSVSNTLTYVPADNTTLSIYAVYAGDSHKYDSNTTDTYNVPVDVLDTTLVINVPSSGIKVAEAFTFNVSLTNTTGGQAIGGKNINVTVNGQSLTVAYDSALGVYVGTYTPASNEALLFKANYTGDNVYRASYDEDSSITTQDIELIDTVMGIIVPDRVEVAVPFNFKVNLTNMTGDAIGGQTVTVVVNGENVNVAFNSSTGLYDGVYTPKDNTDILITASTQDTAVYKGASAVNNTLTGAKIDLIPTLVTLRFSVDSLSVNDTLSVYVSLTNATADRDFVSGDVLVYINGEYYTTVSITDSEGVFTFTPQDNTVLEFVGSYAGDGRIYAANTSATYTIPVDLIGTTTKISVPDTVKVNESFNFTISLTNGTKAIPDKNIVVTINDEVIDNVVYDPVAKLYNASYTPKDNKYDYEIRAVFGGDTQYASSEDVNNSIVRSKILLINTSIGVISPESVNVSNILTMKFNITDEYGKKLNASMLDVYIRGEAVPGEVVGDYLVVKYPTNHETVLPVSVEFIDHDGIHNDSNVDFVVSVVKINTTTFVKVINNTAGNVKINVSVRGYDNLDVTDGNITVIANGHPYDIVELNGQKEVTIDLTDLTTYGNFSLRVQYSGNYKYELSNGVNSSNVSQELINIEVVPQNITFTVNANESVYVTEVVNITGVLKDGFNQAIANRNVIVRVIDEDGHVDPETVTTDSNGVYTRLYTTRSIGLYNVTVYYGGQDAIPSTTRQTNFTVNLIPTRTVAGIYNSTAGNFSISVNVTDNRVGFTDNAVELGRIRVDVGETTVYHDVTLGENIIKLDSITNNESVDIAVTYEANDKYNSSDAQLSHISARIKDTIITVSATPSTQYNKTVTINGTLRDELGEAIECSGKILFTFNGSYTYSDVVTTDSEGRFAITITAGEIGNFEVNASFIGIDGEYASSNASATFDVSKVLTDTEVLIDDESASDLRVLFRVYNDTTTVEIGNVTLYVGETAINVTDLDARDVEYTRYHGNVYVVKHFSEEYLEGYGITGGVTSIRAVYAENSIYLGSEDTYSGTLLDNAVINVTVSQPSIYVDGSVEITVNVTDLEGHPIRGILTLEINDNVTTGIVIDSSDEGIYTITYSNSTADTYNVKATLATAIYGTVFNTTSFNITKIPTRTNVSVHNDSWGNASIDVVVYDARTNTTISTGDLHIAIGNADKTIIDRQIVSEVTNIPVDTKYAGEFAISVVYLENPTYLSSNGVDNDTGEAVVIMIVKHDANLTVTTDKSRYFVGENVTISGYLFDVNTGLAIADATVEVVIRNSTTALSTYYLTTDSNGYYEVNRTTSVAGTFDVNATFEGLSVASVSNINAVSNDTTYTVERIPTTTTVECLNSTYGNVTISVNVKGDDGLNITDGILTIKFGEEQIQTAITGNVTVIKLPSVSVGVNSLNVSYPGNTKYVESNNTAGITDINVQKQNAVITVFVTPSTGIIVGDGVKISGYVYDGINNQTNLINGVVNITFVDDNGDIETESNVALTNSYYEFIRHTKYAGIIDVTVCYIDDTFNNSTAMTSYTVGKIPTNTTISVYNDTFDKVEIAVTIVDARNGNPIQSGKYNLSVNDEFSTAQFGQESNWINSTTFIIPIETASREINVTLNYTGDATHESSVGKDENQNTVLEFESKNQNATLTVKVNTTETYVGDKVNINGTLVDGLNHVITGKINLTFTNGTYADSVEVEVKNGRYSYNRTVNMTGLVNVTASYLGNDTINPANATAFYTIDKLPTKVTITLVNNTVGNLTIGVQVTETYHNIVLEEGNVTIEYGTYVIDDAELDGQTTLFNLTSTSQAPYTIIVNYTGNNSHEFSTDSINTGLLIKQVANLTISAENDKQVDQPVKINGSFIDGMGKAYANKEVTVYVYNSTGSNVAQIATSTDENGNYSVTFTPNKNGTYTAETHYVGDDMVAGIVTDRVTFTVDKIHTTTNVTVLNKTAGNVTIKVKVTDEHGNNITSGQFNVTVNQVNTTVTFTDTAEYIYKLNIEENGTHNVSVYYLGTPDKYYPSNGQISEGGSTQDLTEITVDLQESIITINKDAQRVYVSNNITVYGHLVNGMGEAIPNAVVNLTFVDEYGDVVRAYNVTDANGYYSYHRTTEYNGTINVTATYYGEPNRINASNATISYLVEKIDTLTYINPLNNTLGNVSIETWFVNQLDVSEYIREGSFDVFVNQEETPYRSYDLSQLEPNENGRYTIKLDENFNVGENTVIVRYNGNYKYKPSHKDYTDRLYKDDIQISITLDKNNTYVENLINVNVSMTHNNLPVEGRVNISIVNSSGDVVKIISEDEYLTNGNKSFTFTNDTSDTYTIKVVFNGTSIYNPLNVTETLTLNKLPTETLVDVVSNVIGNVTISVRVNDTVNNAIVTSGYLMVTVDGVSHELNPISVNTSGVTIIKLDTTGTDVMLSVRYLENHKYNGSLGVNATNREEMNDIILSKQPTIVTVEANPNETYLGTPITISGRLINPLGNVNDQIIHIVINNTLYTVHTSNDDTGSYTFTYDGQTSLANGNGTFTVDVSYDPNTNLDANASHNSTTIKVDKIPTNSSIEVLNNTLGNITVNVRVVNATNGGAVTMGTVEFYDKNGQVIGTYQITAADNIIRLDNITESGNIEVTAKYLENDIYLGSDVKDSDGNTNLGNITVANKTATILIDVEEGPFIIGDSVTINGSLVDSTGDVIDGENIVDIRIDNDVYHVNVSNGKFSLVNITYTQGIKKVNATYVGSATIDPAVSATKEFTVNLIPTSTVVSIANTTVGSVVLKVNVTDTVNDVTVGEGTLSVKVGNNESREVSVNSSGITYISLDEITAMDNVTVTVNYLANEKYNASTGIDERTIYLPEPNEYIDINTTRHNSIMEVIVVESPVKVGQNITIRGTLVIDNGTNVNNGTTGDNEIVEIWIGNTRVGTATVVDGAFEYNYTTNQVTSGKVATVKYDGTELVRPSEAEVTYVVEKLPTITIIDVLNNTAGNVTLKIMVNDSFNNRQLNYYDGNNMPLGNLTVYIGSVNVKNVTVSDSNIVTLPSLVEPQPNVRVTVIFTPRDDSVKYIGSQNYTVFTVVGQVANITIEANPNPAYVEDVVTITGRLTDGMNNNISNVELSYTIGTTYDRITTDENGTYTFTYTPTREGVYEVNVSYAGGGAVRAAKATINLTVNRIPTTTVVEVLSTEVENVTIRVNVTDNQNNPVVSGQVNVTVENDTWTSTTTYNITGESTEIKMLLDQADSDYVVKVLYLDNYKYINSTGLDSQGRSSIPIHTVKDNATLSVTANPSEAYVGRNVEIEIILKDDMGNGITSNVTLNFTSEEGSEIVENVQVINGSVVYNRTSHLAGHVNVTVTYPGNDTINPVNATTSYTIIKIPTTTTLVRMINNTIGHITIELRFADAHTGSAITSGSNFTVELVGHPESKVTYNLDEDASDDRFNVTSSNTVILKVDESYFDEHEKIPNSIITFLGNGTYNSSWLLDEEQLEKAIIIIDLDTSESVYINQTVVFNVTVKDGDGQAFDAIVNITLDGELFAENVEIPASGHEFTFTKDEMGNHTIEVIYPGNELLSYATANRTVMVERIPTDTRVTLLNNTYGNVTIKVTVNDTIYNKFVTDGTLIITGGDSRNVTITGTETIIKLNLTTVRNTNVYVRFNGTDYYQPSYGYDNETDEQFEAIEVVRQDATLTIDVQPNRNHVGNESYITGKLIDGMGNNVTDEVVSILINNVTYRDEVSLNSSGEFNVRYVGTLNGTYNISVVFSGNRYIKSTSADATLELIKVETTSVVTLLNTDAGNVTIRVNVTDEFDEPVTDGSFAVNITQNDGSVTQLVVPIEGITTDVLLPIEGSGQYDVNVTYLGTNRFKESKAVTDSGEEFTNIVVGKQDVNLTVEVKRTEVYVGTNMLIQGELRNASGLPIGNANITLTFDGEESFNVTTNYAGYYSYTRPTHISGNVTVTAYYNGTDKYNNATANTSYLVNKIPTNTTVAIVNSTVGNVTIDVQVINAIDPLVIIANGTINVSVNNVTTQHNLTGSVTSIKLNITNCTKANVTVVYLGNDTYANSTGVDRDTFGTDEPVEFAEITAVKQNATLTIVEEPSPVYVLNNVTYTGTLTDGLGNNITGKINITVTYQGEQIAFIENVDVNEGVYSVNRTTRVVGLINVTASYLGNDTINPVNASTEYVIELRPTVTLVNITNNTAGNVMIDVEVMDANGTVLTEGNFTVKVQGQDDALVQINGTHTPVKLNITSATQYIAVSVIYNGNEIYAPSTGIDMDKFLDDPSVNETVTNITVEYQTPLMTIEPIANSSVGDMVVITGHVEDGMGNNIVNRNITVRIGDTELSNITDANGNYTVYYTSTVNGTFTATANYRGNNSVSPMSVNTTFNVTKLKTTTIVEVLNNTAGNVTISVNVTDERGNAVDHGVFNITLDENAPESYLITGNITTIKLDVEENATISVNVTYLGDNQYESSKAQTIDETSGELVDFNEITIVKQDVNLTVGVIRHEVPIGTLMVISGYLTNASGLAIANANITLTFGNVDKVNVTTDSNGHYTYERDTSIAGYVEVEAYYNGSAKYNNQTADTHYTVYKLPTNTTVRVINNTSGNVYIDIVVYDMYHKGLIISNGTLNVTVNNKTSTYTFTTENTTIKLDIQNMTKANVTVVYLGNDTYLNSTGVTLASWNTDNPTEFTEIEIEKQTATLTLLLNDTNLTVFDPIKFNGTFIDGLGNNINTTVSIIVDNGTDSYTYEDVEVKEGYYQQLRTTEFTGTVNVTVVFAGDDNINPLNITESYNVEKRETITLVQVVNDTVGNVVIDVVVKDAVDNTVLTSGEDLIAVSITEGIFHNSIDESGVTRITVPVSDNRQLVRITVDYLGNGTYKPSLAYDNATYTEDYHETITTITVKAHNSTLTIDVNPVNSSVGTTYNISGYFTDTNSSAIVGAGLTINVNGTNFYFTTVEDGYYSINYTSNHEGNYTVTVSYNGDEVINATSNSTTFKVNKIPTNTTVYIVNSTVGNVTLNVTVTDINKNPINGTLNVTIGTNTKQVTITDGEIIIDLEDIGLGIDTTEQVTAKVVFLGNDTYLNSTGIDARTLGDETPSEFGEITADKESAIIGVDVDPIDTIVGNRNIIFGSLNDTNGKALKYADVNITVRNDEGIVYSLNVTTDRFGEFEYRNNTLPAGNYVVNVSYFSSIYNYTSAEKEFTISKINTTTETRVMNTTSGNVTVRVIVNDVEGRAVTTGFVNITDANGNVLERGELTGNNYVDVVLRSIKPTDSISLIANYEGTPKYANSSAADAIELTVVKQDATLTLFVNESSVTVFDGIKFNGTLVDGFGNNINDKVNITVDNGTDTYTYVDVPVDAGYYQQLRTTNLTGTLNVTVSYAGNETVSPLNVTRTYTVDRRETITLVQVVNDTIGNLTIDVVVKDKVDNSTLTAGEDLISVTISEGTFTYTIDASGVTRITVPVSDNRQVVGINVEYLGNGTYKPSTGYDNATYSEDNPEELSVVVLSVHNATLSVDVNPVVSRVGTTYNISGYFVDVNGSAIAGANLIVTVNSTYYNDSVITGEDGYYSVNFTADVEGNYTVTVKFNSNGVINTTVNSTTLRADKVPTSTLVRIVNNTMGNVTLAVNVTEVDGTPITGGVLNITVGDKTGIYTITDVENIISLNDLGLNVDSTSPVSVNIFYPGSNVYINSTGRDADTGEEFAQISADKASAIISVMVDPSVVTIEKVYDIFGNLTDSNGVAISGASVNVTVRDSEGIVYSLNVTTDRRGLFDYLNNTLPAGSYTVNVSFVSDDYEFTSDEAEFTVERINTTTDVVILNSTAGNVTVRVIVNDVEGRPVSTGFVNITDANGNVLERGQLTGKNFVDIVIKSITTNDQISLMANYEGTPKYANSTNDTAMKSFTSDTRDVTIDVNPENNTFGNVSVTVNLTDSTTGEPLVNAPFNITDADGNVIANATTGEDGTATVDLTLPVGSHDLEVVYPGNETNTAQNEGFTMDVNKRPSKTIAEIVNFTANNVKVKVNVTDATTGNRITIGNVTITVDGKDLARGELSTDGTVTIDVPISSAGRYNFVATFEGNTNYTDSFDTIGTTDIVSRESKVTANVANKTVGNTTLDITLTDPITNKGLTDNVTVTLPDGETINVEVKNGKASIPVDLPAGSNNIKVTYPGNDTYARSQTNLTVNVVKRNSTTTATVTNKTAGNVTVKAKVTDSTTNKAVTSGNVVVLVNDKVVGKGTLDKDGVAVIKTNITDTGNYNIITKFEGNSNYTSSNASNKNVKVTPRKADVTAEVTDDTFGDTEVEITITDEVTDAPLDTEVIVTLPNGNEIHTTTEDGKVVVPVDLPVGNSTITVTYPGNSTYDDEVIEVTVNTKKRPSSTSAVMQNNTAGDVSIKATVTDKLDGKAVTSGTVKVYVNGKVVGQANVNNKGVANINTNVAKVGNYTFDIKFEGNANYTQSSTKLKDKVVARDISVEVKVDNNKVTNTSITVNVTDPSTGEGVANETVSVKLPNGTTITVTTDENGIAHVETQLPSGNNNIDVSVKANDKYESESTTINVNVEKIKVKVVVDSVTGIVGENITLTAHLTDEYGKAVNGGNLVFKLNGRSLRMDGRFDTNDTDPMKLSVKNGIVTFTMKADLYLRAGKNITASYSGSSKYDSAKANVAEANIRKRSAEVSVSVSPTLVKQDKNIVFTATIKDVTDGTRQSLVATNDAYVMFKINGQTLKDSNGENIKVKVVKNVAKYTYHIPLGTSGMVDGHMRDYVVSAVYANPDFYPDSRGNAVYNVQRSATSIKIGSAVVKSGKLSIKATILDEYKNNVIGTNKVTIKINGKTYRVNNKTKVFSVKDGVINLSGIDIGDNKVKSLTIVTGERQSYYESEVTTKNVKAL